jgi:hypothetical protein
MQMRWIPAGIVTALSVLIGSQADAAIISVRPGADLQSALDSAQPGDEIVLTAGGRYVGQFRLPRKPFGSVITIRSSAVLPARRITPADAALLPSIASGVAAEALLGEGASNWRLDGLKFESNSGGEGTIIALQDASNVTMDRLLIVAGEAGQKRAITGNGKQITLTRSYIANCWRTGQDSQAFAAWDGSGPYTISDNYLEAASENVLFGGADSAAADRIPADILVEGNHFSKQLSWKGTPKVVKNLFELKAARRATIRNNLFERNWTDGQSGTAILFTVRNQDGRSPWTVVEDVLFERNVIQDTEGVFAISGYDDENASGRATRITLRRNLAVASGNFLLVGGEVGTLTIDHNTVDQQGTFAVLFKGDVWTAGSSRRSGRFAVESLTITNNLANHGLYGVFGEEAGIGTPALAGLTRSYVWMNNVLAGSAAREYEYPAVTWTPATSEHQLQFNADYSLRTESRYRKAATDGQDLGWSGGPAGTSISNRTRTTIPCTGPRSRTRCGPGR